MQSFKYSVPSPPEKRPGPSRFSRWAMAVIGAVLIGGGGTWLWASQGAGWMTGAPVSTEARRAQAAQLLRKADEQLARGELAAARGSYDRVLALQPPRIEAYRRGLDARYLAGAREAPRLEKLLPAPADRAAFLLSLGEAERRAGRLAPALEAYQAAIALAPDDPGAHLGQGRALEAAQRIDEAIASYEAARAKAPHDMHIGDALIQARYRLGKQEAALAEAEALYKPVAGREGEAIAQVGLLEAYIRRGLGPDEVKARAAAEARHLAPPDRAMVLARAYMRHFLSNPNWHQASYDRAIAFAEQARKGGASGAGRLLAEAHAERSRRHFERGDMDAAQSEIARALALKAELADRRAVADLYVRRGHALAVSGKTEALSKNLEYALQTDPTHPCRAELARAYANVGVGVMSIRKAAEAIKPLSRALALMPDDAALFARLYQAHQRARRPGALEACGKAAKFGEPGARHLQLVRGLLALKQPKEAARAAAAAEREKLPVPYPALIKAELAQADGKLAEARQALLQAVERRASDPRAWQRLGEVDRALASHQPAHSAAHLGHAREAFGHVLALGDEAARGTLCAVHQAMAEEALQRGAFDQAAQLAAQGRLLDAHHPWLALAHGTALAALKRHPEAQEALQAGLIGLDGAANPAHAALRERLGQVYRAQARYAEAIKELKTGLAQEAKAPPARCATLYYELAFALAEHGDREEALSATRQYVFWSLHDPRQTERVEAIQQLETKLTAKSS